MTYSSHLLDASLQLVFDGSQFRCVRIEVEAKSPAGECACVFVPKLLFSFCTSPIFIFFRLPRLLRLFLSYVVARSSSVLRHGSWTLRALALAVTWFWGMCSLRCRTRLPRRRLPRGDSGGDVVYKRFHGSQWVSTGDESGHVRGMECEEIT